MNFIQIGGNGGKSLSQGENTWRSRCHVVIWHWWQARLGADKGAHHWSQSPSTSRLLLPYWPPYWLQTLMNRAAGTSCESIVHWPYYRPPCLQVQGLAGGVAAGEYWVKQHLLGIHFCHESSCHLTISRWKLGCCKKSLRHPPSHHIKPTFQIASRHDSTTQRALIF